MKTALIAIILVIIGVIFILYQVPNNKSQKTISDSRSIPGLKMIDGDTYLFYYPKDYIKSNDVSDARLLSFVPKDRQDTNKGISLAKYPVSKRMETPTSDLCKEALQFLLRGAKTVRIADAQPVDFVKSHGCDYTYVDDNVPGKLAVHEKNLWYKEEDDLNVYGSKALYLLTTPQTEKETLDSAVNNFILK